MPPTPTLGLIHLWEGGWEFIIHNSSFLIQQSNLDLSRGWIAAR